jgi:hypothetical protein
MSGAPGLARLRVQLQSKARVRAEVSDGELSGEHDRLGL